MMQFKTLKFAGIAALGVQAVDRLCKDARTGGLARAARAGEQIGMAQLAGDERRFEDLCHAFLPHDVVKGLWTVFTV